jgi:hypothetical protein
LIAEVVHRPRGNALFAILEKGYDVYSAPSGKPQRQEASSSARSTAPGSVNGSSSGRWFEMASGAIGSGGSVDRSGVAVGASRRCPDSEGRVGPSSGGRRRAPRPSAAGRGIIASLFDRIRVNRNLRCIGRMRMKYCQTVRAYPHSERSHWTDPIDSE